MSLWSKIRGTAETLWQVGLGGPNLKNNSGVFEARDSGDTAFVIVRGATPVAANDLATKSYVDSGGASGDVAEIRFAINTTATQNSVTSIPAGAFITDCEVEITTPYTGGTTITVGQTGTPALLQGSGDNLATANGTYQVMQDTAWGVSPHTVLVTVAGAPVAGVGVVIVRYTTPLP